MTIIFVEWKTGKNEWYEENIPLNFWIKILQHVYQL